MQKFLIFTTICFILSSCNKENSIDKNLEQTDKVKFMLEEKTVYLDGVGDVITKLELTPEGMYKVSPTKDHQKIQNFFKDMKETHTLFDESGKMHVFKSEERKLEYMTQEYNLVARCATNYSGHILVQFFKHNNYSSEFSSLRRFVYGSGFDIPVVNDAHPGSNDEITSLSIANNRREYNFAVTLYRHIHYGGSSATLRIGKCTSNQSNPNITNVFFYHDSYLPGGSQLMEGGENDKTSSIKGFYF